MMDATVERFKYKIMLTFIYIHRDQSTASASLQWQRRQQPQRLRWTQTKDPSFLVGSFSISVEYQG